MIKEPCGVCLEIVHHGFWRLARLDHDVDVSRPHMRGDERPAAMGADLLDRLQNSVPARGVEKVGFLIHDGLGGAEPSGIGQYVPASVCPVVAID